MQLVYGVLCLSLSAIVFAVTLLGSRNPREPSWANDFFISSVFTPAIVGFAVMGLAFILNSLLSAGSTGFSVREAVFIAVIVGGTFAVVKLMRIRKTLAAYAAQAADGVVVNLPGTRNADDSDSPRPPRKPVSRKKAA